MILNQNVIQHFYFYRYFEFNRFRIFFYIFMNVIFEFFVSILINYNYQWTMVPEAEYGLPH